MYCRANLIPEDEQLVLLPALLVDGARDVFESLDAETQNDFPELVASLKEKLESSELRSLTATEFLNRDQQPNEHVNEYALALRRLFYLSYAKDTTDADGLQLRSQILIDKFQKGLKPYIAYTMGNQAPVDSFDKAVATAARIESNYYASKGWFPSQGGMYANFVTKPKPNRNSAVEDLEWLGSPSKAFPPNFIPSSDMNRMNRTQLNQPYPPAPRWNGQYNQNNANNMPQRNFYNDRNWQNNRNQWQPPHNNSNAYSARVDDQWSEQYRQGQA